MMYFSRVLFNVNSWAPYKDSAIVSGRAAYKTFCCKKCLVGCSTSRVNRIYHKELSKQHCVLFSNASQILNEDQFILDSIGQSNVQKISDHCSDLTKALAGNLISVQSLSRLN